MNRLFYRLITPLYYSLLLFLIVVSIFPANTVHDDELRGNSWRIDYFLHFFMFFILGWMTFLFALKNKLNKRKNILLFLVIMLYAGVSEFIQVFIPGRSFNPIDLLLNEAGFIAGTIIMTALKEKAIKVLIIN